MKVRINKREMLVSGYLWKRHYMVLSLFRALEHTSIAWAKTWQYENENHTQVTCCIQGLGFHLAFIAKR